MEKIGKYKILKPLGGGAMGKVYLAHDPLINRDVAIKVLSGNFKENPTLLKRFYVEAQAAGKLKHPNIVTIFDMGEEGDLPYIVMEYLEGDSLFTLIKEKKIDSLNTILLTIYQCANALDYAHSLGIVHRDIKPANIIFLKDKTVKIVDFGIARMGDLSLTRDGVALGTPYYMSPEQINGEEVDGRSDIFSLGVVFYEMLTFNRPFTGDNLVTIFKKILSEEIPPIEKFKPDCPEEVKKIVLKALKVDKLKRYQKAGEMAEDISKLLSTKEEIPLKFLKTNIDGKNLEVENLLKKNKELFFSYLKNNNFERAEHLLTNISSKVNESTFKELEKELKEKKYNYEKNLFIKNKIEIATALLKEKKLKEASELIEEALLKYPEEKLLIDFLKKIDNMLNSMTKEEELKKSLKEIFEILKKGNFTHAENKLKSLMTKYPDEKRLKKLYLNIINEKKKMGL